MAHRRPAESYDDIVRRTVPDPDSSVRPSTDQERQAREGFRAMDEDEQALYARVSDALLATDVDLSDVLVEIERTTVLLRGRVDSPRAFDAVETIVESVEGVTHVMNRLVIGAAAFPS